MSFAVRGPMLIVDASCLYDVVADGRKSEQIRARFALDPDQAAPHVVDVEVLGIIRRDHLRGRLDATAAQQAVEDLRDWRGERFGHRSLLDRAWELRFRVRGWDAMYMALAEVMDAPLITLDQRLGRVSGLRCQIEVLAGEGRGRTWT